MSAPGVRTRSPRGDPGHLEELERRLAAADATIEALLAGQVDAVVDTRGDTPVLLFKAQEALRESEEEYRQIVETTSDGIVKLDSEARIVFANQPMADMLGYDPGDLTGRSIYEFMNDTARVIAEDSFRRRLEGNTDVIDTTFRHRDGTDFSVHVTGSPLYSSNGTHIGNLGIIRDVTEQRKLQAQLMISDRLASVGTLAAGVAHEINNPLAAVMANLDHIAEALERMAHVSPPGSAEAMSNTWLRSEIAAPLADAREAAQRVRFIVRDLKIFSRSSTDEQRGPVDVRGTMESSLRMAWNEIRHRAHLVKHYGPTLFVDANEARLGQVFLNLLINAAQSLRDGDTTRGEIVVATRLTGGRAIIEVSDNGPGIPPEIIGRIFDAFFTTKAVGGGTGLGLAICQRIITDMNGELTVQSTVGQGTVFRVSIPAVDGDCPTWLPALPPVVPGRRGRIMVVDDEAVVLRAVTRLLSREHSVVSLTDAREALALCASGETFDLILCDLMMPAMTGMDFHRELMLVAPEQAKRMIFLTGGAFTSAARAFLSDVPKEHIEKPFDFANLRAIIQRHLRSIA